MTLRKKRKDKERRAADIDEDAHWRRAARRHSNSDLPASLPPSPTQRNLSPLKCCDKFGLCFFFSLLFLNSARIWLPRRPFLPISARLMG